MVGQRPGQEHPRTERAGAGPCLPRPPQRGGRTITSPRAALKASPHGNRHYRQRAGVPRSPSRCPRAARGRRARRWRPAVLTARSTAAMPPGRQSTERQGRVRGHQISREARALTGTAVPTLSGAAMAGAGQLGCGAAVPGAWACLEETLGGSSAR